MRANKNAVVARDRAGMQHSTSKAPMRALRSPALRGRVTVPGDKSISHRALILGALATGRTAICGLLEADDVLGTAAALAAMGVPIEKTGAVWLVHGRGTGGLTEPDGPLDFGNAGTGSRLMMGVVAGHEMSVVFTGDASLQRRPMGRVLKPLQQMGLIVRETGKETLPLTLEGSSRLRPIEYRLEVPSAQVKSAILIAGLHAAGKTTVVEREPTRDHTERMLRHFGAEVAVVPEGAGARVTVTGDAELIGRDVIVPGDPSSAAFLAAAALIVPGSDILVENVLMNPTRTGFYVTLQEMGATIEFINAREAGGEAVADMRVRHSPLTGVSVPAARAPSMIDEYPMLAALAAYAKGTTHMAGLAELKVKESDRLAATAAGLALAGVDAEAEGDTLRVLGTGAVRGGGPVATRMDHRIAMAFLTMGLGSASPVSVDDIGMIATSFPEFPDLIAALGGKLEPVDGKPA